MHPQHNTAQHNWCAWFRYVWKSSRFANRFVRCRTRFFGNRLASTVDNKLESVCYQNSSDVHRIYCSSHLAHSTSNRIRRRNIFPVFARRILYCEETVCYCLNASSVLVIKLCVHNSIWFNPNIHIQEAHPLTRGKPKKIEVGFLSTFLNSHKKTIFDPQFWNPLLETA